jgi:hypothetical protein
MNTEKEKKRINNVILNWSSGVWYQWEGGYKEYLGG